MSSGDDLAHFERLWNRIWWLIKHQKSWASVLSHVSDLVIKYVPFTDLSFLILWNYGLESHDYYFAIQDKLIYPKVLITDSGLICQLLKYSRNSKALTPQRFLNIFT